MATSTQAQSIFFTKLPAEIRVIVYSHILCEFRGKGRQLLGALSSCKQMSAEIEHELTRAFLGNLTAEIKDIEVAWNAELPPFRVALPAHTEDLKYDAITLGVALPYPAVQSRTGRGLLSYMLAYLTEFHFKDINFSFYHGDAYPTNNPDSHQTNGSALPFPLTSLVRVPGSSQMRSRVPRAQRVTLEMDGRFDSFETIYRLWYHVWRLCLDSRGYDMGPMEGEESSPFVHYRKKA